MSDLQNLILMFSKTNQEFSKEIYTPGWKITLPKTEIDFVFKENGDFEYICNNRVKNNK